MFICNESCIKWNKVNINLFELKKYFILFRVPALNVTHDEETNEVSVDVCDDPYQYGVLDVSNLPVLITVGQVNKI